MREKIIWSDEIKMQLLGENFKLYEEHWSSWETISTVTHGGGSFILQGHWSGSYTGSMQQDTEINHIYIAELRFCNFCKEWFSLVFLVNFFKQHFNLWLGVTDGRLIQVCRKGRCGLWLSCLWVLQAAPMTSCLGFYSENSLSAMRPEIDLPMSHVSVWFTRGRLQLRCRNMSKMIKTHGRT